MRSQNVSKGRTDRDIVGRNGIRESEGAICAHRQVVAAIILQDQPSAGESGNGAADGVKIRTRDLYIRHIGAGRAAGVGKPYGQLVERTKKNGRNMATHPPLLPSNDGLAFEGYRMRSNAYLPGVSLLLVAAAAAALTSCGSSTSTGSSPNPPPGPQTTHVAVADTGDNRILIYDTPLTANGSPGIVIGQASFTQGSANQGALTASAATLYSPHGVAIDSAGDLWVADRGNCRVLEFKPPFATGMSASVLIGQSDFGSTGTLGVWGCPFAPSLSSASMESPVAVALDSQDNLWVADEAAGRITEYVPPFSNGMAASVVIGQPDMQSTAPCNGADVGEHGPGVPPTAATLCSPEGIVFDSHGDLWIVDQANWRVLEFVPPFTTGMAASLVLGQPDATEFTGNGTCVASAATFCGGVNAVAFDAHGDVWASDWTFNRVLDFVPPFSTRMAASLVIGQANFTDYGPYPTDLMNDPNGIAFDGNGNLIVTDESSEILVYAPPFSSAMNPATIISSGLGSCPPPGPTVNTLCEPVGIVAF